MEARAVGRLHGSAQHTQIAGQGVDIHGVDVFFRRAHQHAESGATRRHEVADDQRVGTVLIEAFAVLEPNPADAFPGRLPAVNATSALTWSAYGVMSCARTSRRPRTRTKSTTPIARPLDCASTMGMPWTTVFTRTCV